MLSPLNSHPESSPVLLYPLNHVWICNKIAIAPERQDDQIGGKAIRPRVLNVHLAINDDQVLPIFSGRQIGFIFSDLQGFIFSVRQIEFTSEEYFWPGAVNACGIAGSGQKSCGGGLNTCQVTHD